jgi:hypothetical protein
MRGKAAQSPQRRQDVGRLPTGTEMEDVCEGLRDGLIARMGEPTWLAWTSDVRIQIKNLIATVVEEAVLEDPEALSKLGLGERPVPVRRARAFLLDPAAVEPLVRKLGGSLPRVAEMTLDIASAGIFFLVAPWRLGRGLGRLPVRWAVAGGRYGLFLEFGVPPGLPDGILVDRIFRPNHWEVQGQRVYLFR